MIQSSPPLILLIATRNAHKVGEIRAVLGDRPDCLTLYDFPGAPKVIEDGDTFAGNATKKAVELARWLSNVRESKTSNQNCFVLADDSGLEVDALGGAPGVHSARFAALDTGKPENSPDADNNEKLLRLLKDVPMEKRTARFRCVLALISVKGANPQLFEGTCEGRIGFGPRGQGGFGYDPLFLPVGFELSFAELGEAVKNGISHRARALARLKSVISL